MYLLQKWQVELDNHLSGCSQESFNNSLNEFPPATPDFLSVNIQNLIFNFDEQDREGIKQLLQMPYYHGVIKEIIDVNFVLKVKKFWKNIKAEQIVLLFVPVQILIGLMILVQS